MVTVVSDLVHPAIILVVHFRSDLPDEEMKRRVEERMPRFREFPGLIQKYYSKDPVTGEWGGIYLWDSKASLDAFVGSELQRSIGAAYAVKGEPTIHRFLVGDVLRPERQ